MRSALVVWAFMASVPVFAECPGYTPVKGWENDQVVHYDVSGVTPGFQDAAKAALNRWNEANANNGSGVFFMPATGSDHIDLEVVEGKIDAPDVAARMGLPNGSTYVHDAQITVDTSKFAQGSDKSLQKYFTKLMLHEVGHTMPLADVTNTGCSNAGVTVMNQLCKGDPNDSMGLLPDKPTPCDNDAIKKDPQRKKPKPPITRNPDPDCKPGNGPPFCPVRNVCLIFNGDPECRWVEVCEGGDGGPYHRFSCSGTRAQVTTSGPVCGDWNEIANSPTLPGDYACQDPFAPFQVPRCDELGLHVAPQGCSGEVEWTADAIGLHCYACPGTVPPLPPDPNGGGCVPQTSCGFSTGQSCTWMPDGCGGQHLCGTCGTACGVDMAGNIIPCDGGGGPGSPTCDGAHNETCYPSFKACTDECCGVCERRISCGGASAHKCFEP